MNDELKPCPFCGGTEVTCHKAQYEGYVVACDNTDCQTDGPWDLGKSGAIAKWNHRVTPVAAQPEASTATANQTFTWKPGDAWSEYTAAMDGPEVYVTPPHIVDAAIGSGAYLEAAAVLANPPYAGDLVRVPILGTLDSETRIPQP